jgi:hypothetical protein
MEVPESEERPLAIFEISIPVSILDFYIIFKCRLTGDVAEGGSQDAKVNVLEPGRSILAKDEVGGTLDQTVGVDLVASLGQEGVLETSELDTVVSAGGVGAQGDGLAAGSVAIVDIDIVQLEVRGLDTKSGSLIVAQAISLAETGGDGDLVAAVARGVASVTIDGHLSGTGAHEDLLAVCALINEDTLGSGRAGRERVDGSLNGSVVTTAAGDGDTARGSRSAACCHGKANKTQAS